MLAQGPQPCQNHAGVPAAWQCDDCHIQFCDQCVNLRNFGQAKVSICLLCAGKCSAAGPAAQQAATLPIVHKSPILMVVGSILVGCVGLLVIQAGISRLTQGGDRLLSVQGLKASAAHGTALHPCRMTLRCLVVYLAPWCSYCQRSIPIIQELRQHWEETGDIGIIAVIGRDSPGRIQEMAGKVGEGSYVDLDGSFWKKTGVQGVPVWFLINDQGEVQQTIPGAPQNSAMLLADLQLD